MSGKLECVRVGTRLFTTPAAVRRMIEGGRVKPLPRPRRPEPASRRAAERAAAAAEARRRLNLPDPPPADPA
jgi:hypothetical protein